MKPDYAKVVSRTTTLAISLLLAAALLARRGGSQEQGSEGEQGSEEETNTTPSGETANVQGGDATAEVAAATEAFLATLDDAQREQVSFGFDDELKETNWSNLPAPLVEPDLSDATLPRADLTDADLSNANLQHADLRGANLEDTKLEGTDLSEANLEGATGVTAEELEEQAASLEAATMPDGTEHD